MARHTQMCASLVAVVSANSQYGPGRAKWENVDAASQGLSGSELRRMSQVLEEAVPHRHCLVVVKNGQLIHESYHGGFHAKSVHRSQSMGKTTIAALIGVLVQKGLLDLDKPIAEYGVQPNAWWSRGGVDHFPSVTARHLLGMSSGYGKVPPGSMFSYDSDSYTQHLSSLIEILTKERPIDFANRELAKVLGMAADHFSYDGAIYDIGGNISAGGGQMITCLDAARIGQLVLNGGRWLNQDGQPTQVIPESYAEAIVTPSFQERAGYGLLTWINGKAATGDEHACCSPRWGYSWRDSPDNTTYAKCCLPRDGSDPGGESCDFTGKALSESAKGYSDDPRLWLVREGAHTFRSSPLDDLTPEGYAHERAPHDLAWGMGQYGQWLVMVPSEELVVVSMGHSDGEPAECSPGYDEAWLFQLFWNMLSPALRPDAAAAPDAAVQVEVPQPEPVPSASLRKAAASADVVGSCMCDCPAWEGYGLCFDVDRASAAPSATDASQKCSNLANGSAVRAFMESGAPATCPSAGHTLGCVAGQNHSNCGKASDASLGQCHQARPCGPVENMPAEFLVETCECPVQPAFTPCVWRATPCDFGAYYPAWQPQQSPVVV